MGRKFKKESEWNKNNVHIIQRLRKIEREEEK